MGILTRLQVDIRICVEEKTESGRIDGTVHRLGLKDDNVYLYNNDGKPVEKIALLEVKTGNIKPLQAVAYAYTEGTPAVIAEVKRGSCHLVDLSTEEKLLAYAAEQLGALKELKGKEKRIPDPYKCESCTDASCEHWDGRDSSPETRYIIKERTKQLSEHLSETVDELVDIVESLLRKDNMFVERGETE